MQNEKAVLNLNSAAWRNLARYGETKGSEGQRRGLFVRRKVIAPLLSLCGRMQQGLFREQVQALSSDAAADRPVVITGHWRSGTTHLHTLLSLDPQFTFPTTASCMNPHAFMLGAGKVAGAAVKRPMDEVMIAGDSPQEDEFALLAMGARSPYEALLYPRHLADALSLADPDDLSEPERRAWQETFLFFTRATSLLGGKRPVVLKSPTHTGRVGTIAALLPQARFVMIRRNPQEVFESTFRMWRSMFDLYALGPPLADDGLRQVILDNRVVMERKFAAAAARLPAGRLAYVDYERLVADPLPELHALYQTLGLDSSFLHTQALADKLERDRSYTARRALPPADWQRRVEKVWTEFF
ncbi:sulfotransferase family protein [Insolitispirillum peregrinum]|uniref:Sulfotransferase family protein n=1 Tax=Insolitispirillum peregrinum TaxID=80876 RepID=A0A1N7Q3V2_9PROT|nr:sulfotransferase [Insolitispirillum peregrinum]SIT17389.1 Sulfotransferase family protein [Insolitispirillum peregrinum]